MQRMTILMGSPNLNGSSSMLAKAISRGANLEGCNVSIIKTGTLNIEDCIGCTHCQKGVNPCALSDDMGVVIEEISAADTIVLVVPVFFFSMPAKAKVVIDRLYCVIDLIKGRNKKLVLAAVCGSSDIDTMHPLVSQYRMIADYMHWQTEDPFLVLGCDTPEQTEKSGYIELAEMLGRRLGTQIAAGVKWHE